MAGAKLLASTALVGVLAGVVGGLGAAWFGAEHFDQFKGKAGATGPAGPPGPRGPQGAAAPRFSGGMLLVSQYASCPEGTRAGWGFDQLEINGESYNLCTIG
jgi:hypothetical protein